MVATIIPIKDQKGYYCKNFRKCVIIEVIENHMPIRQAVRHFWKTKSRREESLYTKTVRSWINVFKKHGVYIMKDLTKIPLKAKDFIPTNELIKIESVENFDEAAKLIKKLQMAIIHQNAVIDVYKEKLDQEIQNKNLKKKSELINPDKAKVYNTTVSVKLNKTLSEYLYPLCETNKQNVSYYNHIHEDKYILIKVNIEDIFEKSYNTYGYRRVYYTLLARGFEIGINKVLDLMNELDLHPYVKRRQYHSFNGDLDYTFKNLVNRNFHAENPYELLFSDVTMIKTPFGDLYLSPVIDAFNNEVLYYNLSEHPDKEQALDTFKGLIAKLPEWARPILHTDQGWQYKNKDIIEILDDANITQSMSRKGNCLDNGMMESWFGRLKNEKIYNNNFKSLEEVKQAIHEYIKFYNEERIQERLGWISPKKFKEKYEKKLENSEKTKKINVFAGIFQRVIENFRRKCENDPLKKG